MIVESVRISQNNVIHIFSMNMGMTQMTDILEIDIPQLFIRMTGREPDSDDMAIFDQVFYIERGFNIPEGFSDSLRLHARQYDNLLDAMNLGLDENDSRLLQIKENPSMYRLLLFYNLLKLNNILLDGSWIRTHEPLYSANKIGYRGRPRILNRTQYEELMRRSNRRFIDSLSGESLSYDNKFPIRLIYASVINSELIKYPFSSSLHSTIREMCHHESLRYVTSTSHRIIRDLSKDGPIPIPGRWDQYEIEFYKSIDDVPTSELFIQAMELASDGAYGRVLSAQLGDEVPIFMKYNDSIYDTIHEYRIGRELNEFYRHCPFIMYTYGMANLRLNDTTIADYQAILDNQSGYKIAGDEDRPVLMAQWLPNSMPLSEFIKTNPTTFRFDSDGKIVETTLTEALEQILMAIMTTLEYLWDSVQFVHGDLHFENIQIVRFDQPQVLPLPGYPGRVFNLSSVPILIDYGFSTILRPNMNDIKITRAIIPDGSIAALNPTEERLNTEDAHVGDILRLLTHMYEYSDIVVDENFYQLIASTYYTAFTGEVFDDSSNDLSDIFNNLLNEKIGGGMEELEQLKNRMIPLKLSTYYPDRAISRFVQNVHRPVRIRPILESTEYSSVDRMISDIVREEGLIISTYSGAIAYRLYLDQLHEMIPTYTLNILQSFQNLEQLLQDSYSKTLIETIQRDERFNEFVDKLLSVVMGPEGSRNLFGDPGGYLDLTSSINLQYVYRYQINEIIKTIVLSTNRV